MRIYSFRHSVSGNKAVLSTLALSVLSFFWGAGATLAAAPAVDRIAEIADGEKALARLKELGANVVGDRPTNEVRRFSIQFEDGWHGTDSDLQLIGGAATLGEVVVHFDLQYVTPQAVSKLRLRTPPETLWLNFDAAQRFQQLTALPACRNILVFDCEETPEDYRHFVRIAQGVESMTIFSGASDDALAELAALTTLKQLVIEKSPMTGAGLDHLSGMKRLEQLKLTDCPGVDGDLDALPNLASLRKLDLDFQVSAIGVLNIGKLAALEDLRFPPSPLKAADAEPLALLGHLKYLAIEMPPDPGKTDAPVAAERLALVPLGSAIARATATMPGLEKLSLELPMDENGLAAVAAHDKLEVLSIELPQIVDRSLALISRLPGLKSLNLRGEGKLSDSGIAHLSPLTTLTELELPGAGLTDVCLSHLAGLTAIQTLGLPNSKIAGAGFPMLRPLARLKSLKLAGSSVDDEACRSLGQFSQLDTLDLSHTKITDSGLKSIAKISTLDDLKIENTAITDHGVAHLAGHLHISSISAVHTSVTEEGVAKLLAAIPKPAPHKTKSLTVWYGDGTETRCSGICTADAEEAAPVERAPTAAQPIPKN